jgi:hypothetical protein
MEARFLALHYSLYMVLKWRRRLLIIHHLIFISPSMKIPVCWTTCIQLVNYIEISDKPNSTFQKRCRQAWWLGACPCIDCTNLVTNISHTDGQLQVVTGWNFLLYGIRCDGDAQVYWKINENNIFLGIILVVDRRRHDLKGGRVRSEPTKPHVEFGGQSTTKYNKSHPP